MTRTKLLVRPVAALGAAALALSLTACGGGASDAPDDASEEDFCEAFNNAYEPLASSEDAELSEDQFNEFQDGVAEIGEVGTPEGISEEEREGFEIFVEEIADLSYDDFQESVESGDEELPGVSQEDSDKAGAFAEYAGKTCLG